MKYLYRLVTVCILVCCYQVSHAQFERFKIIKDHTSWYLPTSLAVADMNGDGKPDMISRGNAVVCSFNNGTGQSFTHVDLPASNRLGRVQHIAGVDLDKDGRGDVIGSFEVGSYEYKLMVWYGNSGNTFSEPVTLLPSFPEGYFDTSDIDKDGLPDVVLPDGGQVTGANGTFAFWLRNRGRNTAWTKTVFTNINSAWFLQMVDLNNDGQQDALTIDHSSTLSVYTGTDFKNGTELASSVYIGYRTKPVLTDVDNDGDLDIAVLKQYASGLVWLENKGNLQFTVHTIETEKINYTSLVAGDLDNDGDPDLVAGCWTSCRLSYFMNNGRGSFTRTYITTNTSAIGAFIDMALADVDSDGKKDIVITDGREHAVTWLRNTANTLSTGIEAQENLLELFPNPSQGKVHLKTASNKIRRIQFYDAQGKLVKDIAFTFSSADTQLELQDLAKGLYNILIYTDNKKPFNTKLILQ